MERAVRHAASVNDLANRVGKNPALARQWIANDAEGQAVVADWDHFGAILRFALVHIAADGLRDGHRRHGWYRVRSEEFIEEQRARRAILFHAPNKDVGLPEFLELVAGRPGHDNQPRGRRQKRLTHPTLVTGAGLVCG